MHSNQNLSFFGPAVCRNLGKNKFWRWGQLITTKIWIQVLKSTSMSKVVKHGEILSLPQFLTEWPGFWCKWKVLRTARHRRLNFWEFFWNVISRREFVKKGLFLEGFSSFILCEYKKINFFFLFLLWEGPIHLFHYLSWSC